MVTPDPGLQESAANIRWIIEQGKHRPMRILRRETATNDNLVFWLPGICSNNRPS